MLVNAIAQVRIALPLEKKWGSRRFLLVYFGAGINGAAWSCATQPAVAGVGSSAALCGVVGAWLFSILCDWQGAPSETRRVVLAQALLLSAICVGSSLCIEMVDFGSHIGGFMMGALVVVACEAWKPDAEAAVAVATEPQTKQSTRRRWCEKAGKWLICAAVPLFPVAGLVLALALADGAGAAGGWW